MNYSSDTLSDILVWLHTKSDAGMINQIHILHGMESKPGENFLSLQCKDRGGGGSLRIFVRKDSNSS